MGNNVFEKLTEKYPFISLCMYANAEYVGVIQNKDDVVTTIYDFGAVADQADKLNYLELASVWWWESNRQIPINIFLRREIEPFRYCIKTFNSKDVRILLGPVVNLLNLSVRRIKRKSVQLVRKR